MNVYIRAAHSISPQDTFPGKGLPKEIKEYKPYLKCIQPDFKQYISPLLLRRMNNLIKAGNVCAIETLKESKIEKPDCIITATGLGCIEDTEKFLNQVLQTNEGLLAPTAFIQSTHNTIGAQVALNVNCHGYNVLYAHKTSSFENALLDAILLIQEKEASNILVGGFDEITDENYELKKGVGIFKSDFSNLEILNSNTCGSIAGEGINFFLLSNIENPENYALIESVSILSLKSTIEEVNQWHSETLKSYHLSPSEIDMVLCGINGDAMNNKIYKDILDSVYSNSTQAYYKHMCGEYDTSSAYGLWFAANAIKNNTLPKHSILTDKKRDLNTVVLYNQDDLKNHCLILLKKA